MVRILFLCTGNACRSQMAEGWARRLKRGSIEAFSAGVEKHGLDPRAVKVMAEVGVDISDHESKLVEELADQDFDYVVTLCDKARESCPFFPGETVVVHRGFDNPPVLAEEESDETGKSSHYRRVRDQIKAFVETLPDALTERTA
jgi:arsenate reductase